VKRWEVIALFITLSIVIGLPVAVLGYQRWLRPALAPNRVIDIIAAVPESGGFQPGAITISAGETVTLRFSSADVTHGIAIGPGLGLDLGHVDPGHVKEVTLTFDQPGTYTFYCNAWCSPDHWRMRGVVEVKNPDAPDAIPTPQHDPVIDALVAEGVDIDADHSGESAHQFMLERSPSARRGGTLATKVVVPRELMDLGWRRSHTPAQGLDLLLAANPWAIRSDAIDVIAYLWIAGRQSGATTRLYDKNCTACHGQTGDGHGPASKLTVKPPVAIADPAHMFLMRSDVLYAKIRRGGMGTDMPNFGTVFTPEETWALVDRLWSLTFDPGGDLIP
jgi:plastocyanin/mono/diheme cytochrome c family protein